MPRPYEDKARESGARNAEIIRQRRRDIANTCGPADARTVPFDTGVVHGPAETPMGAQLIAHAADGARDIAEVAAEVATVEQARAYADERLAATVNVRAPIGRVQTFSMVERYTDPETGLPLDSNGTF